MGHLPGRVVEQRQQILVRGFDVSGVIVIRSYDLLYMRGSELHHTVTHGSGGIDLFADTHNILPDRKRFKHGFDNFIQAIPAKILTQGVVLDLVSEFITIPAKGVISFVRSLL